MFHSTIYFLEKLIVFVRTLDALQLVHCDLINAPRAFGCVTLLRRVRIFHSLGMCMCNTSWAGLQRTCPGLVLTAHAQGACDIQCIGTSCY